MVLIIFAAIAIGFFIFMQMKKIDTKFSFLGAAVVFLVLAGLSKMVENKLEEQPQSTQEVVQTSIVTHEPITPAESLEGKVVEQKDLGIKPETFRNNYNAIMAELDLKSRISKTDINKVSFNGVFIISLSDGDVLSGIINKNNGNLKSVTLIFKSGSYLEGDGSGAIAAWAHAASIDKAISGKKNVELIADLMSETLKQYKETDEMIEIQKNVGGYEYTSNFGPALGLWFSIRPTQ